MVFRLKSETIDKLVANSTLQQGKTWGVYKTNMYISVFATRAFIRFNSFCPFSPPYATFPFPFQYQLRIFYTLQLTPSWRHHRQLFITFQIQFSLYIHTSKKVLPFLTKFPQNTQQIASTLSKGQKFHPCMEKLIPQVTPLCFTCHTLIQ